MRATRRLLGPWVTCVAWIALGVNTILLAQTFELGRVETKQANAAGYFCGWKSNCGAACVAPPGPCQPGAYLGGACSTGGNNGTDGVATPTPATYGWCLPDFNYWSTATCTTGTPCGTNTISGCGVLNAAGNCSGPGCFASATSLSGC